MNAIAKARKAVPPSRLSWRPATYLVGRPACRICPRSHASLWIEVDSRPTRLHRCAMELPTKAVTLSVEQIRHLNQQLSNMRHDINNHLSMIVAVAEVMRINPETGQRMAATLSEQPPKIARQMERFSAEFEAMFGITRF